MTSVLKFLEHVMVYRAPFEDDTPEVAAWKRARLALPGVEEDASLHVALLLVPDLAEAIWARRTTDRRVAQLNVQALVRHQKDWARYLAAVQDQQAGHRRGGTLPQRPGDQVVLHQAPDTVSARTEELFATALGATLGTAERAGLLYGPSPWHAFAPKGRPNLGYRRPRPLAIHQRNVLPIGRLVDLADVIGTLGPLDRRTGRPTGDRFRALVLAFCAGGRPSEYAGLHPDRYLPGPDPVIAFHRSGEPASPSATDDGTGFHLTDRLKGRDPGTQRPVGIPRYVADALDAHIARGYAVDGRLFTAPEGGPLRYGNLTDTYWRPAVARVCGTSSEKVLQDLEFRWLRKGAITWMLRSGMSIIEVAELTGHSPAVLLQHYAGIVGDRHDTPRLWTGWDAAWDWAAQER